MIYFNFKFYFLIKMTVSDLLVHVYIGCMSIDIFFVHVYDALKRYIGNM